MFHLILWHGVVPALVSHYYSVTQKDEIEYTSGYVILNVVCHDLYTAEKFARTVFARVKSMTFVKNQRVKMQYLLESFCLQLQLTHLIEVINMEDHLLGRLCVYSLYIILCV